MVAQLEKVKAKVDKTQFTPAEFEKDDDENFHIEFINASANLRATNYKITNSDKQKTKMIAGKIIPAIATTTAMITGSVCTEMYKFVQGYTDVESFKNGFVNLALPLFVFSEPAEVRKIKSKDYDPISMSAVKSIPEGYTLFDKTVVDKGSLTFKQLFEYLEKEYGIEVSLVTSGKFAVYNEYMPKHKPRLQQKIEDVFVQIAEEPLPAALNYLCLEFGGAVVGEDDMDFQMPTCKYIFRKN